MRRIAAQINRTENWSVVEKKVGSALFIGGAHLVCAQNASQCCPIVLRDEEAIMRLSPNKKMRAIEDGAAMVFI